MSELLDGGPGPGETGPTTRAPTNGVALTVLTVPLPSGSAETGTIKFELEVTSGSDSQGQEGLVHWAAANKGGTYSLSVEPDVPASAVSAGTLTADWELASGSNQVQLQVTVATSLAGPSISITTRSV